MSKTPQKPWTAAEVARGAGVSVRRIHTLVAEGVITKLESGGFDPAEAMRAYWSNRLSFENSKSGQTTNIIIGADGTEIDVEMEKARKAQAERIQIEIKNDEALGRLAPIDLLVSTLGDVLQSVNLNLESVPGRVKRVYGAVPGSVLEDIEREMAKLRNQIADARIQFTDPRMEEFSREPGGDGVN